MTNAMSKAVRLENVRPGCGCGVASGGGPVRLGPPRLLLGSSSTLEP